jgi:phage shock protein PspC (stress-responsive transcriptional regulator)
MTEKQKDTQSSTPDRRLLRSRDERMLTGVAGGLGQYLNVDPTFVRLGFFAAAFFGGFGLLAYLIMTVVVPEDDGEGNPVTGKRPPTWALIALVIAVVVILPGPFGAWGDGWWWGLGALWLGLIVLAGAGAYRLIRGRWPGQADPSATAETKELSSSGEATQTEGGEGPPRVIRFLAIGVLACVGALGALCIAACGAWVTATGNGAVVAGLVVAFGVALAATAFFGDSARRTAPWLLALALLLAVPAGTVAAADIEFDGGVGERTYSPAVAADIPADGYEHGVGQLVVDLRDYEWGEGELVTLPAELGIGQLLISVPSEVCVFGEAEGKVGEVSVRGEDSDGVEPEFDRASAPVTQPRLQLDADIQIGQLLVTDRDPEDFSHDGPGPRDRGDHDELTPLPEACR